jgi:hypothetical protein
MIMELYRLSTPETEQVRVYGREPLQIIGLVNHYRCLFSSNSAGLADAPAWIKKGPSLDDIVRVNEGSFMFQIGKASYAGLLDTEFIFEGLRVTDDFTVFVEMDSLDSFDALRKVLDRTQVRDTGLYAIQITGGRCAGLTFVPKDISEAMRAYDLTPHLGKAEILLEQMRKKSDSGLPSKFLNIF